MEKKDRSRMLEMAGMDEVDPKEIKEIIAFELEANVKSLLDNALRKNYGKDVKISDVRRTGDVISYNISAYGKKITIKVSVK